MEVAGEHELPLLRVVPQPVLDRLRLERHGTDLEHRVQRLDLLLDLCEVLQLLLEVVNRWISLREFRQGLLYVVLPEPAVLREGLQVLTDEVLCTVDGPGKQKDDLDDLLVLRDHVIERLFLLSVRLVLLEPVDH